MKITFSVLGLLLSVGLFVLGCMTEIPDKWIMPVAISDIGYREYVGGDAYNYIIEASLRGGEIAGGKTARAIYFSAGGLLFVLSGVFLGDALKPGKIKEELEPDNAYD